MKYLVVIDIQNDFVTGILGTEEAKAIVPKIKEYIDGFDGKVLFTMDTHFADYERTREGLFIPKHCEIGSVGWEVIDEIADGRRTSNNTFMKGSFGSVRLAEFLDYMYLSNEDDDFDVYFCGVCTDICVISNVLLVNAFQPEIKIHVLSELCAGTSIENHEAALNVMRGCLVDVI